MFVFGHLAVFGDDFIIRVVTNIKLCRQALAVQSLLCSITSVITLRSKSLLYRNLPHEFFSPNFERTILKRLPCLILWPFLLNFSSRIIFHKHKFHYRTPIFQRVKRVPLPKSCCTWELNEISCQNNWIVMKQTLTKSCLYSMSNLKFIRFQSIPV